MKARDHEERTSNAFSRVSRRARSLSTFRCAGRLCARRSAFAVEATRTCLSQEGKGESKPARPETKGQPFRFGPRGRFVEGNRFRFPFHGLASEFLVHDALADDARNREVESIPVVHFAPVVITEHLFIERPEQVKRFDPDVGSLQRPLKQAQKFSRPLV
jgi:hypothetical protein